MPDNNINSIVKDENNTLWIGTKSGLASKSDVTTFAEKDIEHNSLKIYPNSVNRYLSIKADQIKINKYSLLNTKGQILKKGDIKNSNQSVINVSEISKGFYLLKLKSSQKVITKKIIIK